MLVIVASCNVYTERLLFRLFLADGIADLTAAAAGHRFVVPVSVVSLPMCDPLCKYLSI